MDSKTIPFSSPLFQVSEGSLDHSINDSSTHSILTFKSGPKTDWWRTSIGSTPESNVNRRSGPIFSIPLDMEKSESGFKAGVWMRGDLKERFQQICLILYAGEEIKKDGIKKGNENDDETNWLKAGVELEHGKENIGCVIASPYSDWSISPTPKPGISYTNPSDSISDQWLYVQISSPSTDGPDVSIHVFQSESSSGKGKDSLPPNERPDDEDLVLIRECRAFNVIKRSKKEEKAKNWRIGVMTCGPLTESFTEGLFADFSLEYL